ncbi:hypothetical protein BG004_006591 [Podila humilis]|nr:hypothetical protein BG004_006591 [Podila humilis]
MDRNISDYSTQQHLQQCMLQLGGQWVVQQAPSMVPGGKSIILQWTRKELAQRRRRRQNHGHSKSVVQEVLQQQQQQADETVLRGSYAWTVRLWGTELTRIRGLIESYPGHESLWYHLRFVYYGLRWLDSEETTSHGTMGQQEPSGGHKEYQEYVRPETEATFVQTILQKQHCLGATQKNDDTSKDLQSRLCEQHLEFVRHLDISHD